MRRLPLVAFVAAFVTCLVAPNVHAATPRTLRPGDRGPDVAAVQWLLGGHKPNVFTKVKGTYTWPTNGIFGPRTSAAVYAYKYRLGYPARYNSKTKPVIGPTFLRLVEGKSTRPAPWIANAAKRLAAVEAATPTKAALKIKALELTQLGVTEVPVASNFGPQVSIYQSATGDYHVAWCVSFQQWASKVAGFGTFADDTAAVYYAVDYFAKLNRDYAKPKVGALVAFIEYESDGRTRVPGSGHMGFVVKVTASGFSSIEGNQDNGVHEVFHAFGSRSMLFIYRKGIA